MVLDSAINCLHTFKWFQVFPSNTNNSNQHYSFICMQLNGFKHCYQILIIQFNINHFYTQLNSFQYSKWLNISIWPIDRTLLGTSTLDQRVPGGNDNEGILHIHQSFRNLNIRCSLLSYPEHSLGWVLPLCKRCSQHILQPQLTGINTCRIETPFV